MPLQQQESPSTDPVEGDFLRRRLRLVAVPQITSGRLKLYLPRGVIELDDKNAVLYSALHEFTGFSTVNEILSRTEVDVETMVEFVKLGVLTDASQLSLAAHAFGENPMTFASTAPPSQIVEQAGRHAATRDQTVTEEPRDQLEEIFRSRRSTRSFDGGTSLAAEAFLQLCIDSLGGPINSYPSAGGIYSTHFYGVLLRGSDAGVYEFDRSTQILRKIADIPGREQMIYALDSASLLHCAPGFLVAYVNFADLLDKYSNRGYRFALLEAGHALQAFLLRCVADKYDTLEWGAFNDASLADALGIGVANGKIVSVIALGPHSERTTREHDFEQTALHQKLQIAVEKEPRLKWITRKHPMLAGEPVGVVLSHLRFQRHDSTPGYAGGVARTTRQADISAIAEGFERLAWMQWRSDFSGTYADAGARMTVFDMPLEDGHSWASLGSIDWLVGETSIGEKVAAPAAAILSSRVPDATQAAAFRRPNSSGTAVHVIRDEARRRAVFELIERDAFRRAWYGESPLRQLEMSGLPDWFRATQSRWKDSGISVLSFLIQGAVPTVVVAAIHRNYSKLAVGAAASASCASSLEKAWFEAASGFLVGKKPGINFDLSYVRQPSDHATFYMVPHNVSRIASFFESVTDRVTPPQPDDNLISRSIMKINPVYFETAIPVPGLITSRSISKTLKPLQFGRDSLLINASRLPWRPDLNPHPFP